MATRHQLLIVEDEADMAFLVSESFRSDGYGVRVAKNGVEGLKLARKHKPDLIISDVMMPLMNGHEMISQLRKESEVPVVFLTAKNDEADSVRVKLNGDEYMTKPFSMDTLAALVKHMLRRAGPGRIGLIKKIKK